MLSISRLAPYSGEFAIWRQRAATDLSCAISPTISCMSWDSCGFSKCRRSGIRTAGRVGSSRKERSFINTPFSPMFHLLRFVAGRYLHIGDGGRKMHQLKLLTDPVERFGGAHKKVPVREQGPRELLDHPGFCGN